MSKWQKLCLNDQEYTILSQKVNNVWRISLTNLVGVWSEELETQTVLERCKTLNPLLKIQALNVDEIMAEILTDIPNRAVEKSINSITLQKNIQGGIFKFRIELSKGSDEDFFEIVTKSLCLSSMELFRRYSLLMELIKKKDEEISEYKAVGAKLIRKNIETKRFTEELFNNERANRVSSLDAFQSVVGLCNETVKLNLNQEATWSENLKSPVESGSLNVEVENKNVSASSKSEESSKRQQEEKRRKAKKPKKIAISASFTKPAVKKGSRVTNFIS